MSEKLIITSSEKEPKINSHVTRLNRFLPFSASHDQIYEEYQTGEDSLDLETKAISYVINAIISKAECIILTGDAGHGKTHLCRRVIEEYLGYDKKLSRKILLNNCNGENEIEPFSDSGTVRKLRIHKDFSEIEPLKATEFIEKYGMNSECTLIICANEGRLRAVINSQTSGETCKKIKKTFNQSFRTGMASTDGIIHIVNLNFQSVAANSEKGSLLRRTLHNWVKNKNRWNQSCGTCSLSDNCPIKKNRDLLGDEGVLSEIRLEKLESLCSTVERLGYVITIREMLMLVSYFITGGLNCEEVKKNVTKNSSKGWQNNYVFYNLLFVRPETVSEDRLYKGIPILSFFLKLDPGRIASRIVDDRLLNEADVFKSNELDLYFEIQVGSKKFTVDASSGIDEVIGSPQSRNDLAREAESVRKIVSALRRRSFFDEKDEVEKDTVVNMLKRLGFRHGDDFLLMLDENLAAQNKVRMKNLVIAGLHGIQGLRMSSTETTLFLVDPAFGRASADAAIIARKIPTSDIQIIPSGIAWKTKGRNWTMPESVDWIDRSVIIRVDEKNSQISELSIDLLAFECIARSASGYISEDFYEQEMRRIRTFLGKIAERGKSLDGQINLFLDGKVHSVSLDEGVIQVGGGV